MIIKVCGITNADQYRKISTLDVDWLGFNFYAQSKRYAGKTPFFDEKEKEHVGIFVNEEIDTLKRVVDEFELDFIQLHGQEDQSYIDQLSSIGGIIKVIPVSKKEDLEDLDYRGIDFYLFDYKTEELGGSGRKFDWDLLRNYDDDLPFLLAGGIGPKDAEGISKIPHPFLAGLDLNSQFESEAGIKDPALLQTFIKEIRDYDI